MLPNWLKIKSKLFGADVHMPAGTVVHANTEDKFDAEYVSDPNIGHWFYSPHLGGHVFPTEYLKDKKLYRCKVVYKGADGAVNTREFDLPFDDWVRSTNPVSESVVNKLLS